MQLPFITVVFEFEVAVSNKLLRTSTPKCAPKCLRDIMQSTPHPTLTSSH
jgi:hypothetical protein